MKNYICHNGTRKPIYLGIRHRENNVYFLYITALKRFIYTFINKYIFTICTTLNIRPIEENQIKTSHT